jgi:hypothetical protein
MGSGFVGTSRNVGPCANKTSQVSPWAAAAAGQGLPAAQPVKSNKAERTTTPNNDRGTLVLYNYPQASHSLGTPAT